LFAVGGRFFWCRVWVYFIGAFLGFFFVGLAGFVGFFCVRNHRKGGQRRTSGAPDAGARRRSEPRGGGVARFGGNRGHTPPTPTPPVSKWIARQVENQTSGRQGSFHGSLDRIRRAGREPIRFRKGLPARAAPGWPPFRPLRPGGAKAALRASFQGGPKPQAFSDPLLAVFFVGNGWGGEPQSAGAGFCPRQEPVCEALLATMLFGLDQPPLAWLRDILDLGPRRVRGL